MGLEDLGLKELMELYPHYFPDEVFTLVKKIPGGLEIECPFLRGLSLNTILRTPTRILLRLGEFKCRDAPKLYQKISKFPWSPWLLGQTPKIESSATNSRLFDSRKIEKAIADGILQYYRHCPVKKKYLEHLAELTLNNNEKNLPTLYFRAVDDICTLSLDTTGERLHLRGEKILSALAPIRENLAALLLRELESHMPKDHYTLIDPMCGSGTFLSEAYNSKSVTNDREFSFHHLPLFLENKGQWKRLESSNQEIYSSFLGQDINEEVVAMALKNCQGKNITIAKADLFEEKVLETKKAIVIINPPYGIRVGEKSDINLTYYLKIIEAIFKKFSPVLIGIIIPNDYFLKSNSLFKVLTARPFKNGGIDVTFYVLKKTLNE